MRDSSSSKFPPMFSVRSSFDRIVYRISMKTLIEQDYKCTRKAMEYWQNGSRVGEKEISLKEFKEISLMV